MQHLKVALKDRQKNLQRLSACVLNRPP